MARSAPYNEPETGEQGAPERARELSEQAHEGKRQTDAMLGPKFTMDGALVAQNQPKTGEKAPLDAEASGKRIAYLRHDRLAARLPRVVQGVSQGASCLNVIPAPRA